MNDPIILWDLDDDPNGNVQHIAEHGFSKEDVEDVLLDDTNEAAISRSSREVLTFGYTRNGAHIAVVWRQESEEDEFPVMIYPITAYAVEPKYRR